MQTFEKFQQKKMKGYNIGTRSIMVHLAYSNLQQLNNVWPFSKEYFFGCKSFTEAHHDTNCDIMSEWLDSYCE